MPKTNNKTVMEIPLIELEGTLLFSNIVFPEKAVMDGLHGRANDKELYQRLVFGFYMAKSIISLYSIEVMLKYVHQKIDKRDGGEIKSRKGHDIGKLFNDLPPEEQHIIEYKYMERWKDILVEKRAIEIMSLQSLITVLTCDTITDLRYYWDREKGVEGRKLPSYHNGMDALGYGIAVGLLGYGPIKKP